MDPVGFYLGHFSPVQAVEEVVGPSFVGVGLQRGLHAGGPGDPNPLFFMVPPVPVEPEDRDGLVPQHGGSGGVRSGSCLTVLQQPEAGAGLLRSCSKDKTADLLRTETI